MLSTCTEELISTPKIITILPNPLVGNEKVPFVSNPIPYPDYLYLSISTFFTNLTAPNREFPSIESLLYMVSQSYLINNAYVYYFYCE